MGGGCNPIFSNLFFFAFLCCHYLSRAVMCSRWGLPQGGRGYEGKKEFVYLKPASHFWISIQKFIFGQRKNIFCGLGWLGPKRGHLPSPPLPPPRW